MKHALLVTIIDNTNIGTFLQAYASVDVLKRNGLNVRLLHYVRPKQTLLGQLNTIFRNSDRRIIGLFKLPIHAIIIARTTYRLLGFLKQNQVAMTCKYIGYNQVKSHQFHEELLITGSDQVWNSDHNSGMDYTFFLDFGRSDALRYAFAASIGKTSLIDCREEMIALLKRYTYISVRESHAKVLLEKEGITWIEQVLDPTLMLSSADWWQVIMNDRKHNFEKTEPYLLVYSVEQRDEVIMDYARKIADSKGLKIYGLSSVLLKDPRKLYARKFSFAHPVTFLSLFAQADFVVASSFHGTAFSVNFARQFISISPFRFNSRIESLLQELGLQNRIVSEKGVDIMTLENIDYGRVNLQLEIMRCKTLNFVNLICK